ncbi:diaminopimelate decarboxylase [Candidatus Magnetoovum chiemensis]|nr:diaminopimelate decarboxylase [Candidatus Magnetoovum chiemensis]
MKKICKYYIISAKKKGGLFLHFFKYKKNILHVEDIPVPELAEKYGTPLYVYSCTTLLRHYDAYEDSFAFHPHLICFALKANTNGAVLRLLAKQGAGADIVSGGEFYRALKAGISPSKIVYAGVGKTEAEIEYALKEKLLMFNVESTQELKAINDTAARLNTKAPIALRVNPDIDPLTHPYVSTGLKKNKFGIPYDEAVECYKEARKMQNVEILGIHKHIGSQIININPFLDALKKLLDMVDKLQRNNIPIKYLDIGGGLGIQYLDEVPPHPSELASQLKPLLKDRDITIILEPGRTIVGNAGILVSKVLYTKKGHDRDFIIVDAGMNDLVRPSMYGSYHHIMPVVQRKSRKEVFADIVGPICESGDFLGKDREITEIKQGELAAVMSAGAYGYSMSSNYNSRPKAAEVLVKGSEHYLIKEREVYEDLLRGEKTPDFLLSSNGKNEN